MFRCSLLSLSVSGDLNSEESKFAGTTPVCPSEGTVSLGFVSVVINVVVGLSGDMMAKGSSMEGLVGWLNGDIGVSLGGDRTSCSGSTIPGAFGTPFSLLCGATSGCFGFAIDFFLSGDVGDFDDATPLARSSSPASELVPYASLSANSWEALRISTVALLLAILSVAARDCFLPPIRGFSNRHVPPPHAEGFLPLSLVDGLPSLVDTLLDPSCFRDECVADPGFVGLMMALLRVDFALDPLRWLSYSNSISSILIGSSSSSISAGLKL